jgi:hypothetical protein
VKKVNKDLVVKGGKLTWQFNGNLFVGNINWRVNYESHGNRDNQEGIIINEWLLERISITKFDALSEEIRPRVWIVKLSYFWLIPIEDY